MRRLNSLLERFHGSTSAVDLAAAFVFGSIVGSFLNVVIHRVPKEQSIVSPGSRCPSCGHEIRWYDNIPLVSYGLLTGRCRSCGEGISARYPLVEFLTAMLCFGTLLKYGLTWNFASAFILSSLLIAISFIDLDTMLIPDSISLPGVAAGLGLSFLRHSPGFVDSLLGAGLGAVVIIVIIYSYGAIRGGEGMGGGDIRLLALSGAFTGWNGAIFSLVAGSFAGSLNGLVMMLFRGKDMKYAMPFGPFLSLGAILYLFWGEWIIGRIF
jgi:leader peptidase (prepilin peptidase) / N-methyltransferase